jgi:ATP-dependent RNA helicase DeaD
MACHVVHPEQSAVEDEVDQEGKEPTVTRGQNVVYQMPHDWASIAHVLAPVLDRIDEGIHDVQLLIVCADAEAAAGASASVVRLAGSRALNAIAATTARRAARLLRVGGAQVVAGAPPELLALVQGSSLKLDQVRCVVLAWVDELIAGGEESMLETLMAEIPKESARVVVANDVTPGVEALIERYARRARRVAPPTGSDGTDGGVALQYVTVSSSARLPALRRLLDDLDPARGLVYVRTEDSEREVRDLLRALGYGEQRTTDEAGVRVGRAAGAAEWDVVILYDIPASREELREAVGPQPRLVVALAQPRLIASLRVLAGQGAVTPLTLSEAGLRARSREEIVRGELRDMLESSAFARELLTLEPLLESYDGIEIAAATLRLLEQARFERDAARARTAETRAPGVPASTTGASGMTRLFINVGAMDNARPGDLVGAITNEAHITSVKVGKIDIRENHSLVEIASDVADSVVAKLTGSSIRGRRVVVRVDQERSQRPGAGRGGRGPADRADRGGERGTRRDMGTRRDAPRERGSARPRDVDRPRNEQRESDRSAGPRSGEGE